MKKFLLLFVLMILITLLFLFNDSSPILIESRESKNLKGEAITNRIQYHDGKDRDVWVMQQGGHEGSDKWDSWDRLSIVVDKRVHPYQASFYQYKPGPLVQGSPTEMIPWRARCFACHSNGPRAIRPKKDGVKSSLYQKLQVALFNMRIKSYGQIKNVAFNEKPIDSNSNSLLNRPLALKSCLKCHSSTSNSLSRFSFRIRNELTLQNLHTVKFLVREGEMPPFPFKIGPEDLKLIENL